MIAWNDHWERLRRSDVMPFPLAVETNWAKEGWLVNLVVLVDITADGYESAVVAQYTEPYATVATGDPDMSPEAATAVTRTAVEGFAERLKRVLADAPSGDDKLS